jgi:very-short-patch-repair endonuclease
VTVPGRTKKGHKGIRVHNVRSLDVSDTAEIDGIPVTSLPRTLLDYAEVARSHQQLRHALDAAERRELLDHGTLQSLLARSVGRRGAKRLRAAVGEMRGPAPWTQSGLERAFLALIREAGLPEPQANVLVAGELVDFFWPEYGLVVETDGYDYHKSRASFESDRRRDAELQLAGLRVVRFTEAQVWQEPRKVVRIVTEMLARARQRRVA